jgi:hypothetical protein
MRRHLAAAVFLVGVQTAAANAGVNVDINIASQSPVAVAASLPPPPRLVIGSTPRFIFSPALGFYVSVGIPYDIVYVWQSYYLYSGGYWYCSPYYDGPWIVVGPRKLPTGLRKHRLEEIRRYRDLEFRNYEHDRQHYHGQWYSPKTRRTEKRREERRDEQYKERRDDVMERQIDKLKSDILTGGR